MSDEGLVVRSLGPGDLGAVVELHRRVFPGSVLTELGPEALRRYYAWQLDETHQVEAFGAFGGAEMAGLLLGGRFRGSMIGFVKQHAPFLAGQVLRRPQVVAGRRGRAAVAIGARLLLRPAGRSVVERPERVPEGSFGVLVVAVDPGAQRAGVGRLLLAEAEQRARGAGFARLHLTVDPSNWNAASFYRDLGWRRLEVPGDTDHAWLVGKELGVP